MVMVLTDAFKWTQVTGSVPLPAADQNFAGTLPPFLSGNWTQFDRTVAAAQLSTPSTRNLPGSQVSFKELDDGSNRTAAMKRVYSCRKLRRR